MAEREDGLTRLQAVLAGFDDRAFEALASRGLLRRARGDLEKGEVGEVATGEQGVVTVRVGEHTVTLPETGPAQATCTCPADEICRHILAACLHVKAQGDTQRAAAAGEDGVAAEATPAQAVLLGLSVDGVRRWAGKKAFGEALETVHAAAPLITEGAAVVIAFPDAGVECHCPPGGGLDSMVVGGAPARQRKHWAAAAVLAYHRAHGKELPAAPDMPTEHQVSPQALRARRDVVAAAKSLLEESVRVGLSNVSGAIEQRYTTLGVSAQGAGLPRLSLSLRAIAEDVRRLVARDAQAGEEKLLLAVARAYALCVATESAAESPSSHLIGRERTVYSDTGKLQLAGLGAYPWVTESGYEGLTVVFWHNDAGEFLTWSDARPRAHAIGFSSRERYEQPGPWAGTKGPHEFAQSQFELRAAKRNALNRLSGSSKSSARVKGPTRVEALDLGERTFTGWERLAEYAASVEPSGLREPLPTDDLVIVEPAVWGRRGFDPISQTLFWELQDSDGNGAFINVKYGPVNQPCVEALEGLTPPGGGRWLLLGSLVRRGGAVSIFPISVLRPGHRDGEVVSLAFGAPQRGFSLRRLMSGLRRRVLPPADGPSMPEGRQGEASPVPHVAARLAKLEDCLQHMAEVGGRSLPAGMQDSLRRLAAELGDAGLSVLARGAEACAASGEGLAASLLRARYLCHLHAQALGAEKGTGTI
jgi:hypothetical protein